MAYCVLRLRNRMARQKTLKHDLPDLDGRRVVKKPAYERYPKSATKIAVKHLPDAGKDEQECKKSADIRRDEVDRLIFPVIAPTMARNTRPPSSGYPGIRLNSTSARLM